MSTRLQLLSPAIIVAALGYFVDAYDLILFLVLKNRSLVDIGINSAQLLETGAHLLNYQMIGLLLGGLVWGVLGDKVGRTRVLFGSIIIYSLANIANAFVTNISTYAGLRFIAGFGLAGELGAGITLVAEILPKHLRGYGTTLVASVGVLGAALAGITGEVLPWRTSYIVGGILGLALLTLRVSVKDSEIFDSAKRNSVPRGNLAVIVSSPARLGRYLTYITLGLPTWYVVGILVANATAISEHLGVITPPKPGWCIAVTYLGLFVGDATSGLLSQRLRSRKQPIAFFTAAGSVTTILFLSHHGVSVHYLYFYYFLLGTFGGYWILLLTSATERFGTNIRATVTTTIPNFIRGAVVPMNAIFLSLRDGWGIINAALFVGLGASAFAALSLMLIKETFYDDLHFIDE